MIGRKLQFFLFHLQWMPKL